MKNACLFSIEEESHWTFKSGVTDMNHTFAGGKIYLAYFV